MLRQGEQEQEEQRSESISDRKILEENQQSGQNANNIPIFFTGKSAMYSKKLASQYLYDKSDYNKNSISIQIMQGDCDCNLPTSPTQPKNFSENSSLRRNLQDQPQIINLFNVESVQQKEGDLKSYSEEQQSVENMEIPQECQSINHSQKLRKQEIQRALAFYQQGNIDQKLESRLNGEQEQGVVGINNNGNNQNIGPSLFLHQNQHMNSSESNQNQSSSIVPRQAVYQMNPVVQIPNQPLSQQLHLIPQNQNAQAHDQQQNQGGIPLNFGNNIRAAMQDIQQQQNALNNDFGLGYFQLKHMLKILRAIMISMGITGFINLFLMILSIVGLKPKLQPEWCKDAQNFIWGVLIPICILSFAVSFLDFFGVIILHKREYQNLSKKQLTNMRLKVSDLQNCNNILKALHVKYPWLIVPQFFLKSGQFFVIIFSSIYYSAKSEDIKDQCQEVSDINMIQYLTIMVIILLAQAIRACATWKKKYDAQNLRNIRNCKFFKYKNESQLGKCEGQCIICYMDYQTDEDLAILPCKAGHIFHKNCVGYWLEINQCCPTCKQTI